jgi:hypothetical protein
MRPVLLDNPKANSNVVATLDVEEKLTLVVQTYNYCGNPPGVIPGQDGEKCRQFLSLLDQTLIKYAIITIVNQEQNQRNTLGPID